MGSGLIYAVIIGAWAAYFIPLLLRRHDELSESRSAERFSRAMRILSRREPTPDRRYVVRPHRSDPHTDVGTDLGPDLGSDLGSDDGVPAGVRRAPQRAGRGSLAVRRRRILAVLLLVTVGLAAAVPFSPVPWWAPLLALAVTVGDLVHLRAQARRSSELSRVRDSVRRRTRSRLRRFDSAERVVAARRAIAAERAAEEAFRREAAEAEERAAREEAVRQTAEAMGWEPVPVPLPTYVSKPKAPPRIGRGIDLPDSLPWGDPRAAAVEEPFDQTADWSSRPVEAHADEMDELDVIIERRRAVND